MRREVEAAAQETLRRLAGHKVRRPRTRPARRTSYNDSTLTLPDDLAQGAVFTAAFSPCTRFLVTGSDDRTLRVWDLALLPPRPAASASTSAQPAATEEHPHLALWGHSARVWRAVFLAPTPGPPRPPPPSTSSIIAAPAHSRTSIDELGIASVAEDGTARVWRVSPAALDPSAARTSSSASAGDKGYVLVATFRDGHDGRSLWAVEGAGTGASEDDGRRVVLTGGADGAVRTWTVPQSGSVGSASAGGASSGSVSGTRKGLKVKAFVAVESAGGEEDERDLVVVLRDDGCAQLLRLSRLLQLHYLPLDRFAAPSSPKTLLQPRPRRRPPPPSPSTSSPSTPRQSTAASLPLASSASFLHPTTAPHRGPATSTSSPSRTAAASCALGCRAPARCSARSSRRHSTYVLHSRRQGCNRTVMGGCESLCGTVRHGRSRSSRWTFWTSPRCAAPSLLVLISVFAHG